MIRNPFFRKKVKKEDTHISLNPLKCIFTTKKNKLKSINDYKIGKLIGDGTSSTVYVGKQIKTNTIVAIKMIQKEGKTPKQTSNSREHFNRELDIHSLLKHPNIIELYVKIPLKMNNLLTL